MKVVLEDFEMYPIVSDIFKPVQKRVELQGKV